MRGSARRGRWTKRSGWASWPATHPASAGQIDQPERFVQRPRRALLRIVGTRGAQLRHADRRGVGPSPDRRGDAQPGRALLQDGRQDAPPPRRREVQADIVDGPDAGQERGPVQDRKDHVVDPERRALELLAQLEHLASELHLGEIRRQGRRAQRRIHDLPAQRLGRRGKAERRDKERGPMLEARGIDDRDLPVLAGPAQRADPLEQQGALIFGEIGTPKPCKTRCHDFSIRPDPSGGQDPPRGPVGQGATRTGKAGCAGEVVWSRVANPRERGQGAGADARDQGKGDPVGDPVRWCPAPIGDAGARDRICHLWGEGCFPVPSRVRVTGCA